MFLCRTLFFLLGSAVFIFTLAFNASAQAGKAALKPAPTPTPSSTSNEDQEQLRIITEEVRLPVVAYDDFGNFDPTLVPDDILVLEDGMPQQVRSVRRIPSSVLILIDASAQITLAKDTAVTRDIALRLLSHVREGDAVSVMQYSDRAEILQDWTTATGNLEHILKTKVHSDKRARFSDALAAAAKQLESRAAGSRHLIMITDGVETPGSKVSYAEAVRQLAATQATVHLISWTTMIRQAIEGRLGNSIVKGGDGVPRSSDPSRPDPTLPPDSTKPASYRIMRIDTDRQMRRWFKKYEADTEASEQRLKSLAEETGGRISSPKSKDEMLSEADAVMRDLGAQYVVSYRPTRPLATAEAGEHRQLQIASRRVGLNLHSRRGYVVK